ncbi:hypothetical protein AgCh_040426 [Apium graveolens]
MGVSVEVLLELHQGPSLHIKNTSWAAMLGVTNEVMDGESGKKIKKNASGRRWQEKLLMVEVLIQTFSTSLSQCWLSALSEICEF